MNQKYTYYLRYACISSSQSLYAGAPESLSCAITSASTASFLEENDAYTLFSVSPASTASKCPTFRISLEINAL